MITLRDLSARGRCSLFTGFPVIRFGVIKLVDEHLPAAPVALGTSNSSQPESIDAVHTVVRGIHYISPRVTESVAVQPAFGDTTPAARRLSDREHEVMRLLWRNTVDEIASPLQVTARPRNDGRQLASAHAVNSTRQT